ncbi:MFS transporter [Cytobacillus sp. IB215665]|uniref:MDR family MFS transporter n=1 Tax=Cytobacillus sp. IB215665 TaxID=3097357 RepID=UPI002A1603B1|nr:MFS transporter [Cytobacillus sp. IB215665]MDX8367459.1 MFS transporter [Cytobacillus sp. IB215665]
MPRSLYFVVVGMAILVTGSSFLWPLSTIYVHDYLGKSLTTAGVVIMFNSAAGVVGNLLGGVIYDKFGSFKTIILGVSVTLCASIMLIFFHDWPHFVLLLIIIGFGSGIIFPAMYALAGAVWPEGERKAFNAIYVAQNIGVALGTALCGFIASYSFTYTFMSSGLLYLIFSVIGVIWYRRLDVKGKRSANHDTETIARKSKVNFYSLIILCVGYLLCWAGYVQWSTTISTYTQELNISLKQYSVLWTINGILIVLGQPLVSAFVKRFAKTLKSQIVVGNIIFICSFIVVANASEYSSFITAMVILTIGEMLVWPAVPTIAHQLAPEGREGFYQGIVNSTATGGRMVGPLLGGLLADIYGMNILFIVLMIFLVISIITTTSYDYRLNRQNQQEEIKMM